jgi:hypothetical protein
MLPRVALLGFAQRGSSAARSPQRGAAVGANRAFVTLVLLECEPEAGKKTDRCRARMVAEGWLGIEGR